MRMILKTLYRVGVYTSVIKAVGVAMIKTLSILDICVQQNKPINIITIPYVFYVQKVQSTNGFYLEWVVISFWL